MNWNLYATHPRIAQMQLLQSALMLPNLWEGILQWSITVVQLVNDLFTFEFKAREAFGQQRHFANVFVFVIVIALRSILRHGRS